MADSRAALTGTPGVVPGRRWGLARFEDDELERRFVEREDLEAQRRSRVGWWFAVAAMVLFGFFDPHVVGQEAETLLLIRVIVVIWFLLTKPLLTPRFLGWWPWLLLGAFVALGWGFVAMVAFASAPLSYITGGTLTATVAGFAIVGPRWRWAVPLGVLVLVDFAVAAAVSDERSSVALSNATFVAGGVLMGLASARLLEGLRRREFLNEHLALEERQRSDRLLESILPVEIADRLRSRPEAIVDAADEVTVVFADIVGFTSMAARLRAEEVVGLLDALFATMDEVCRTHGVEKIKTIGDAYMAVAGLVRPDPNHADAALAVAEAWLSISARSVGWPGGIQLRIGMHSGPVVAGVIGQDKFAYDLWGDTVNTASRMESHGQPGQIQMTEETYRLLSSRPEEARSVTVDIKGKGPMTAYLITPAPQASRPS